MAKRKHRQIYWEPMMQVRHSCILFYQLPSEQLNHKRHTFDTKTYSGKTTNHSEKRIRKAVDILLQVSPKRRVYNSVIDKWVDHTLSFITLTIPGGSRHLTAKEGHKLLLEKWLRIMRRKYGMNTYVWKAELQENGQLHYHITTPAWILYTNIKDHWNNLMSEAGLLTDYLKEHRNQMPNSTDIHAVYKVKNIQSYLIKYLSKKDKDKSTTGKIWDCSLNLKKQTYFTAQVPNDIYKTIDRSKIKLFDYIGILPLKNPAKNLPPNTSKAYQQYKAIILNSTDEVLAKA